MHDTDLERLLSNYRPAGPPPELRARCLETAGAPVRRVWPWVAAAALLLAAALGFQGASARALARSGVTPGPDPAAQERTALADALGGGPEAEQMATLIVAQQELTRGVATPPPPPTEPR